MVDLERYLVGYRFEHCSDIGLKHHIHQIIYLSKKSLKQRITYILKYCCIIDRFYITIHLSGLLQITVMKMICDIHLQVTQKAVDTTINHRLTPFQIL